jgi:hypothetical protein
MARYSSSPIIQTLEDPRRRYINVKYPTIIAEFSDIYVYTTQGDRYDLLAQSYYNDSSLWWIISRANPTQDFDSLFPNVGAQIRIPSPQRLSTIIGQYEALNQINTLVI